MTPAPMFRWQVAALRRSDLGSSRISGGVAQRRQSSPRGSRLVGLDRSSANSRAREYGSSRPRWHTWTCMSCGCGGAKGRKKATVRRGVAGRRNSLCCRLEHDNMLNVQVVRAWSWHIIRRVQRLHDLVEGAAMVIRRANVDTDRCLCLSGGLLEVRRDGVSQAVFAGVQLGTLRGGRRVVGPERGCSMLLGSRPTA